MKARKAKPRVATNVDTEIGHRLRAMRADQGISQDKLGDALGVSFQQIQKYEKGTNRISLVRAIEMAKVLDTSLDQLIGKDGASNGKVAFNTRAYALAQSLGRLEDLSPKIAQRFRNLIDTVSDDLEIEFGKKKKR
jgi:transcriptional regulator with XRE-family HTH domain